MRNTLIAANYHTQYHQLWLRTSSDRTNPQPKQMDPSDEQGDQGVKVYPPTGAVVTTISDWAPVSVIVGTGRVDVPVSDPQFASMDAEWEGDITFQDNSFDVYSFDDGEILDVDLGSPGPRHFKIYWRYTTKHMPGEFDELWDETVVIQAV